MSENQSEIRPFRKPSPHTDFSRKFPVARVPGPVWQLFRGEDREWLVQFSQNYLGVVSGTYFQHFRLVTEEDLFDSAEILILLNEKVRPARIRKISEAATRLFESVNWKYLHPDTVLPELKRLETVQAREFAGEDLVSGPGPVFLKPFPMKSTVLDDWEENFFLLAESYYKLILSWTRQPSFSWKLSLIPEEIDVGIYRKRLALVTSEDRVVDAEWKNWAEKVTFVHDWFSAYADGDSLRPG